MDGGTMDVREIGGVRETNKGHAVEGTLYASTDATGRLETAFRRRPSEACRRATVFVPDRRGLKWYMCSHGNHDLAPSVSRPQLTDRVRHVAQRISRTDHGHDLAGLDEVLKDEEVPGLESPQEVGHPLTDER